MVTLKRKHCRNGELYFDDPRYLSDGTWLVSRTLVANEALLRTAEQVKVLKFAPVEYRNPPQQWVDNYLRQVNGNKYIPYQRTRWQHVGEKNTGIMYRPESGRPFLMSADIVEVLGPRADIVYSCGTGAVFPFPPDEFQPGQELLFMAMPLSLADESWAEIDYWSSSGQPAAPLSNGNCGS